MIPEPRLSGFTSSTPVPLFWREDGPADAPPLLLLHGGPGAQHDYLYPQMLALASSHRVRTYDQRGGGRSRTDDPAPIGWRTQVDDLAAVIAEWGFVPPTIVGYSWGGLLAMLYLLEAARTGAMPLPSRLVLVSPAPITRAWRAEFEAELLARQRGPAIQAMRAELSASGLRERDMESYRHRSFELSVAGYFHDPALATALTPFRVTGRVQQSIWDSLGEFDLRDGLRQTARAVGTPVLVVHGREDPIPLTSAESVAESLGGELVVLDRCGHVPYVEQPAALFSAIEAFLART